VKNQKLETTIKYLEAQLKIKGAGSSNTSTWRVKYLDMKKKMDTTVNEFGQLQEMNDQVYK
jgi:hypothetical protein